MAVRPDQLLKTGRSLVVETDISEPQSRRDGKLKGEHRVSPLPRPAALPFHQQLSFEIGKKPLYSTDHSPINILRSLNPTSDLPLKDNFSTSTLAEEDSATKSSIDSTRSTTASNHPKFHKAPLDCDSQTFSLGQFASTQAIEVLIRKHGRIAHMGILDPSYTFFLSKSRAAALYYKVKNKITVVCGDPLCRQSQWSSLLSEFSVFRKKHGLGIAFLGASKVFAMYATEQGWASMRFGMERALNPVTNTVLAETDGKRIVKQVKQLIRGGTRVEVYVPTFKPNQDLEDCLVKVYQTWRARRNEDDKPQAYMTVFDPFALPSIMIYIYTTTNGRVDGFAALRQLKNGYHIDPYCALPDAPRGITELLIYSAMAMLNRGGVSYLGLGFEPAEEMTEVCGLNLSMAKIVKAGYRRTFSRLPISGKKAFHDKWHPDPNHNEELYIVYPDGQPGMRHSLAMMHFANVSARQIIEQEIKDLIHERITRLGVPQAPLKTCLEIP